MTETPIDLAAAAAELLRRRKATESLHEFVRQAWPQVEGGRDFTDGWHVQAICLPYETKIITEEGPKEIGVLVQERWLGRVLSFNHTTGSLEWKHVVSWMRSHPEDLYSLQSSSGDTLHITGNHPVFVVGRGYVRADEVKVGDRIVQVRKLPKDVCAKTADKREVLLADMLPDSAHRDGGEKCTSMQAMWENVSSQSCSDWKILQHEMFRGIEDQARNGDMSIMRRSESVGCDTLPEVLRAEQETGQDGVLSKLRKTDLQNSGNDGANFKKTWSFLRERMLWRILSWAKQCGLYRWAPTKPIPRNFQTNSSRCKGARGLSLFFVRGKEAAGLPSHQQRRKELRNVEFGCVVSPLSQSSEGDAAGSYIQSEQVVCAIERKTQLPANVFNIEVEGNNNYFAENILVHNCEHLEAVHRGEIRNLLINIPPRFSKSSLCCVYFPVWCWIQSPSIQWVFTSYAFDLTRRDNVRSRRLIDSRWFQSRWGDRFTLSGDQNTKERVENDQGGFRIATSVDARTMGDGGDRIVVDDPNNSRDSSETMLESTLSWWSDVMPTRLNDFKKGNRIVIQQRIHERDLTGHILKTEAENWVHICLPMEFEPKRRCVTVPLPSTRGKKWQDPRTQEGELLCAARVGPKELKALKGQLASTYAISGQLQQRPAPEAGGMFKRDWFRKWTAPTTPKLEFVLTSWDTALSEKETAAYSACTVWGVFFRQYSDEREWMHGVTPGDADAMGRVPNLILLDCIRDRWEYPELRRVMSQMAKDYRCTVVGAVPDRDRRYRPDMNLVESKASGISVVQELNRTGEVFTKFVPDKFGDKMQRVRLITHLVEAGRVWMPCRPDGEFKAHAKLLVEQCLLFPNAESRDVVDTMTQALLRLQYSGWIAHPEDPGEAQDMVEADEGPLY